jgi:hypothetical protein
MIEIKFAAGAPTGPNNSSSKAIDIVSIARQARTSKQGRETRAEHIWTASGDVASGSKVKQVGKADQEANWS